MNSMDALQLLTHALVTVESIGDLSEGVGERLTLWTSLPEDSPPYESIYVPIRVFLNERRSYLDDNIFTHC